jgi:osmotically-inducible protein OsmY
MKAVNLSIIAFAAAAFLAAPVSVKTTQAAQSYKAAPAAPARAKQARPVDDKTLTDRIDAKLKADATLKKFDVDVSVKDGVATLTGKVRTEAEKVRAGRDARVPGVTRVDNQLVVDKDAGNGVVDKVKSASEAVGEKTKEGAKTVGEKTKEGASKTGETITDGWITTKIHGRFVGEDLLKGSDINVDTNNHVVTLKGTVKSEAGRKRAMEIAKTTDGVVKVVDQLAIK